jgi:hypothetical protein
MTETKFRVLLVPPYLFVGCIAFIALLMGGSKALSNLLFAIIWMAIPYGLARSAERYFKTQNSFRAIWVISAWVFCLLMFPVAEALYFLGIDL